MRHFIPATRSLMVLMALRATGVSPKRRRLAGVGLGRMAGRGAAAGKMAGMARVRRGGATVCANSSPARRSALRKENGMFIEFISGKSIHHRDTEKTSSDTQFFSGDLGQERDLGQRSDYDAGFFKGLVGESHRRGLAIEFIFD